MAIPKRCLKLKKSTDINDEILMQHKNKYHDELEKLIDIFEREFPEAELLRPRSIKLDQFTYLNDEEIDKAEEIETDETVILERKLETKEVKPLQVVSEKVPLIAVDTSSIRLGETDEGLLSAFRAAIIAQTNGEMKCDVFGPYVVHITENNRQAIYDYFRREVFGLELIEAPTLLSKVMDRIRNFLERLAQRTAALSIKNGIVLWDGSLTGRTIDTPEKVIREALDLAHSQGNSVVAISKKSWLRLLTGEQLLGLLDNIPNSCYIDIHSKICTKDMKRFTGRVHVAKFTPDGFSFRVDVSPASKLTCSRVLELLMGSSAFYNGYPELLRQAHIHAYFTPNEVLALQTYAIDKYDLEVIRTFDVRRHLLAPFGA